MLIFLSSIFRFDLPRIEQEDGGQEAAPHAFGVSASRMWLLACVQ